MALILTCDERIRRGLSAGEFACTYWPATGQEAIAAALGTVLRDRRPAGHHLPGPARPGGQGGPARTAGGRDPHPADRGQRRQGRRHAHLPPPVGTGPVDGHRRLGHSHRRRRGPGRAACGTATRWPWPASATAPPAPAPSTRRSTSPPCGSLPVVFVCQNNRYAEMTPTAEAQPVANVADRAAGYGIPGEQVDGNDPDAVHLALARRGDPGPERRGPDAARVHDLPAVGPLLRRPDALHPARGAGGGAPRRAGRPLPVPPDRRRGARRGRRPPTSTSGRATRWNGLHRRPGRRAPRRPTRPSSTSTERAGVGDG